MAAGPPGRYVTLLTRAGCHLCDDAMSIIVEVAGAAGADWSATDVDTDPELRAEYGDRVPVVLIDGVEHAHFRVDPDRLRSALTR